MQLAAWLAQAAPQFPDQVTTSTLSSPLQNVVYASGTVGAIIILAGLMLVDVGGVRRVNVFAAAAEKMIGFFIGFTVYFIIGFAIWNWQYYVAFEIESPYWQAIKDWWLGGTFANDFAQNVDPASMGANLNNQQIFIFFLAAFAGIVNVLLHLSVTERMKPAAYYSICVVAAVMSSVLSWMTWGSTRPAHEPGLPRLLRDRVRVPLPGGHGARAGTQGRATTRDVQPTPQGAGVPLVQPRAHDRGRRPDLQRAADGHPLLPVLLRSRAVRRERDDGGDKRRRGVQQPRPRVGRRCVGRRGYRLLEEELHLPPARAARCVRGGSSSVRHLPALADVPCRARCSVRLLRRVRIQPEPRLGRAQAHAALPRRGHVRPAHGRAHQVG